MNTREIIEQIKAEIIAKISATEKQIDHASDDRLYAMELRRYKYGLEDSLEIIKEIVWPYEINW